jgi:hypothetical protein
MKIKEIHKPTNLEFSEIHMGDVFRYKDVLYMKIPAVDSRNCVTLDRGILAKFSPETFVELVNGSFVEE